MLSSSILDVEDHLLDEQEVKFLYNYFLRKEYVITHKSDSNLQGSHIAQTAYYLGENDLTNEVSKVISCYEDKGYTFDRAYVQVYNPSTILYPHIDNGRYSTITFFHPEYDVVWGGEFICYGEDSIGLAVQPIPGRTIGFEGGKHLHIGRAFNSKALFT